MQGYVQCTNDRKWIGFNQNIEVDREIGRLLNVDPYTFWESIVAMENPKLNGSFSMKIYENHDQLGNVHCQLPCLLPHLCFFF